VPQELGRENKEMNQPVKGMIIILGSPNNEDGELSSIARERCELALMEFSKRVAWKILLTGGYGEHFNKTEKPHADYLKKYLINRGVTNDAIVEFAESSYTLQDASLSKPIIRKYGVSEVIVVTSDFHLERARYIFENEYSDMDVSIKFSTSHTAADTCDFDLSDLRKHEADALVKLKKIECSKRNRNLTIPST